MGYESPTVACIHRPRAGPEIMLCFRLRHPAGPPLSSFYRVPFENRRSRHQILVFVSRKCAGSFVCFEQRVKPVPLNAQNHL